MNLQDMINAINRRVDDVVETQDAVEWLNSGKNKMAIAVGAKFPDLDFANMEDTFVFDSEYHEAPVLYASSKFKEMDSSVNEANNFLAQFEELKAEFVKNYDTPVQYRNDRLSQQFIATEDSKEFEITKEGYNPRFGDLKVYINNRPTLAFTASGNTFMCFDVEEGDHVTAIWEEHVDLIEPPYNWWGW